MRIQAKLYRIVQLLRESEVNKQVPKLMEAYKKRYGVLLTNAELSSCMGSKIAAKTTIAAFGTCAVPNLFKCTVKTVATEVELKPVCPLVDDGPDAGVGASKLSCKG